MCSREDCGWKQTNTLFFWNLGRRFQWMQRTEPVGPRASGLLKSLRALPRVQPFYAGKQKPLQATHDLARMI